MERKKNSTIEMSAARMATMMEEAGGGWGVGGDVPHGEGQSCIFTRFSIEGSYVERFIVIGAY